MSAFQIMISPPAKNPVSCKVDKGDDMIPRLILRPFSPTAEVKFGEVIINQSQSKQLVIFNPDAQISILFTNIEADDRISMSESVVHLNSRQEKCIVFTWTPIRSGYLRKVIRAQDSARKARSFEIILSGMAVNRGCQNPKKKKTKTDITYSQPSVPCQVFKEQKVRDLRRETYSVEEKENRQPAGVGLPKVSFRSSSPRDTAHAAVFQESSSLTGFSHNSFSLLDNVDAPTKYSNFESELDVSDILTRGRFNDELNDMFIRRSTLENLVVMTPTNNCSVDNLGHVLSGNVSTQNITFEMKTREEEDVFLTPAKKFSIDSLILTPKQSSLVFSDLVKSCDAVDNLNDSFLSKFTFKSSSREDVMFISPPSKVLKPARKSPDYFIHRTGSSAIKDRRKHLRTSVIARRKSPKKLNIGRAKYANCDNSMEKIKSQNPSVLKQFVTSQCHIEDPFVKQLVYNDDLWIDEQEKEIIKWMNSVLAPPADMCEENVDWTVDGVEAWLKRNQSNNSTWTINKVPVTFYNTPENIGVLRNRKDELLKSEFVSAVFSELSMLINRKVVYVRDGRDIYADECVKNKLLQLLGSYNPVWLRIGLEAIYKQEVALNSKADFGGLGVFIRKNVIVSNSFMRKTEKEKESVRKTILLKFFQLIFFLDQARIKRVIRHNYCLFSIASKYKSSQEILNAFCADLVTGKGYVMKHLKNINYLLQFKQTCIDEYDYTIRTLKDLNDGIRLARLFEILFGERDICSRLRVPAVDIENKKYNIEVAFRVAKTRCKIEGNIIAEDFVLATRLGSRIKILSFLWQIINNYLTPFYEKAAVKIQRWWRKFLLRKGYHLRVFRQKQDSARVIQRAWRCYRHRISFKRSLTEMKIRSTAAEIIQNRFRARLAMKKMHKLYVEKLQAIVRIQSWFRGRSQLKRFLKLKDRVVYVQRLYRATQKMKKVRNEFLKLRNSAVYIQRFYRANKAMRDERYRYIELKNSTLVVQQRYRSLKLMQRIRNEYIKLRMSVIVIQNQYRAIQSMKVEREYFLKLKTSTVGIQRRFRAHQLMHFERNKYLRLQKTVVKIQSKFRAKLLMRRQQSAYLCLKSAVLIIQRRFRAQISMKTDRRKFVKLRDAVLIFQNHYRALRKMRIERNNFLNLKTATIKMQQKFRAQKMMKICRTDFLQSKKAAIAIQRYYRNYKLMKKQREEYQMLRCNIILIQKWFRARLLSRAYRNNYLQMSQSVVIIQRWYRNLKKMEVDKRNYLTLKQYVITVQQRFRAKKAMQIERQRYLNMKNATLKIQRRLRATLRMKLDRGKFLEKKSAAVIIQRQYRATMIMEKHRTKYRRIRDAVIKIQKFYRGWQLMKRERRSFLELKLSILKIQRWYRSVKMMQKTRSLHLELTEKVVFLQRVWKTKLVRKKFLQSRRAATCIQRWWRLQRSLKPQPKPPLSADELAAIKIQALWRGYIYRKKNKRRISTKKDTKENTEPTATLGERYLKAIMQLKTDDRYNVITLALWELETVTTFSAKLCEGVAAEGIVTTIFSLMSRGNRSEPSLELYRACISILINLTLHAPTKRIVWDNMDSIEDLLKLIQIMQMSHDKFNRNTDSYLFRYSVTFLWLICQDRDIAEAISSVPTVLQSISKMKETLTRRCPCRKIKNTKRLIRILPKTITNWYADPKTRTFDDHCFAILNLYDTLYS